MEQQRIENIHPEDSVGVLLKLFNGFKETKYTKYLIGAISADCTRDDVQFFYDHVESVFGVLYFGTTLADPVRMTIERVIPEKMKQQVTPNLSPQASAEVFNREVAKCGFEEVPKILALPHFYNADVAQIGSDLELAQGWDGVLLLARIPIQD